MFLIGLVTITLYFIVNNDFFFFEIKETLIENSIDIKHNVL